MLNLRNQNGMDSREVQRAVLSQNGCAEVLSDAFHDVTRVGACILACNWGIHRAPALGSIVGNWINRLIAPCKARWSNTVMSL